jgi:hypothetical protein
LSGEDALEALKGVVYILIALRDIGHYYYLRPNFPPTQNTKIEYALETSKFIDNNGVCCRLAKIHSILSYPILSYPILSYPILSYPILSKTFDDESGDVEMDDIERAVQNLQYWRQPGD